MDYTQRSGIGPVILKKNADLSAIPAFFVNEAFFKFFFKLFLNAAP
jgi:hypothetical protein